MLTVNSLDSAGSGSGVPKLSLDHVSKVFRGRSRSDRTAAVENFNFDVRSGEFLTIVGPSGCGKSTILNMIAGLLEPSSGRILFDGVEVANRKQHCSYMFQKDLLLPWRNIRENVALGIEVQGIPKRQANERAEAILENFGLGAFADRHPAQLSGGMRQRVALMRTLLCDRDILLLDEPFGSLDALTRSVMHEWLLKIWDVDHRTVVFITHDIEEAVFLSDRVLIMSSRPGRVQGEVVIDLGRPRDHSVLLSHRFTELKHQVLEPIYYESHRNAESPKFGDI